MSTDEPPVARQQSTETLEGRKKTRVQTAVFRWSVDLLAGAIVVGLAACGESQVIKTVTAAPTTVSTEQSTTESPAATTDATTATTDAGGSTTSKVGGSITLRGNDDGEQIEVTLLTFRDPVSSNNQFITPDPGNRYVAARVRLRNVGTTVYSDSPSNGARLIDREDQQLSASVFDVAEPGLGSPKIRPGDQRVGWITVELPKTSRPRTFQFTLNSGFGPETGEWSLR